MPFDLHGLLRLAIERRASDLHLKVGAPPVLRIDHQLVPVQDRPRLTQADLETTVSLITTEPQRQQFAQRREMDLGYGVAGLGRFRANLFQQRGTLAIAFRVIPLQIQTIDALNLPPVIATLAMEPRGMLLVTGTAGSGKSTTLAAMIEHMNNNGAGHILTIEDPIEFLHHDKRCMINQREVGIDTDRSQLASLLRGVISMRLIPRADGKRRVPAVEVMVTTATIRECIANPDKTRKISEVIAAGTSEYGMQTFDQSLMSLYQRGLVSYKEALKWSSNPNDFALKVRGIETAVDQPWTTEQQGGFRERKAH